jgi:hypothetical protein
MPNILQAGAADLLRRRFRNWLRRFMRRGKQTLHEAQSLELT